MLSGIQLDNSESINMIPELSVAFQTDKSLNQYGDIAQRAENYGFDYISVYNDLYYQPAWFPLYEMARTTSTIKIGPAAVNPFTSHPINITANIALLNEVSKGRTYLGLARGAWLDDLGIIPNQPINSMREALENVKYLLQGRKEGYLGENFPIQSDRTFKFDIRYEKIPILLGTWGMKTIRACYPLIDQLKLGGSTNPDLAQYYDKVLRDLSHDFGTSVDLVLGAVCVIDDDFQASLDLVRREVSLYLPIIMDLDPTIQMDIAKMEHIQRAALQGNYEVLEDLIAIDLLQKFAFFGTPEDIIKHTIDLLKSGVQRVEYGTPHGLSMDKGLFLLGEKVLPSIREYIADQYL